MKTKKRVGDVANLLRINATHDMFFQHRHVVYQQLPSITEFCELTSLKIRQYGNDDVRHSSQ